MPTYSGDSVKQFYAYIHARPNGVPFYVGKGHGKRSHKFSVRNPHHKNVVTKHGQKNILVKEIECSSENIAFDLEAGLIKCLRRMGYELVNRTNGGEGSTGLIWTKEGRAKISAALTGKPGRPWTLEAKAKVGAANKGKKRTQEQRAKMVRKNKVVSQETKEKLRAAAYVFWENRKKMVNYKAMSNETKAKISADNKGKKRSAEAIEKYKLSRKDWSVSDQTKEKIRNSLKAYWTNRKRGTHAVI